MPTASEDSGALVWNMRSIIPTGKSGALAPEGNTLEGREVGAGATPVLTGGRQSQAGQSLQLIPANSQTAAAAVGAKG